MSIEKNLDNSNVALVFLTKGLSIRDIRDRLDKFFQQSLCFSAIHLIVDEEYTNEDELINQYRNVQIHNIGLNNDASSDWFCNILRESNCGQIILTLGNIVWKTRYSLERFCLQASMSRKGVSIWEDASQRIENPQSQSLFGSVDNFVFSTRWLLEHEIFLQGISEYEQSLFIAHILAAADNREELMHIVNGKNFYNRVGRWVKSLNVQTFSSGLLLCKSLFEIADKYSCPELVQAAGVLSENIVIVSGKFVSPFTKDSEEDIQLHSLMECLGETIRSRTDLQNADILSTEIVSNLKRPLVSIIVPVYNCEKEIHRCLASIFSQSLKSIEVICVNDGSEDNSLQILREYECACQNMLVMTQDNAGQGSARNRAMSVARGKYFGFVDGDDWIEPSMYETMALQLEEHPEAQLAKCGTSCDFDYLVTDSERKGLENYFAELEPAGIHPVGPDRLMTGGPCDKLYRASLIQENNIRFPQDVKNEDEAFVLFCVCRSSSYVLLKNKFYHYIKTMNGTMNTQAQNATSGKLPDIFDICNLMLDFLFWEGKYSYVGRVIKTILGAVDRFESFPIKDSMNHAVSTLLDKAQFHLLVETVVPDKRAWCKRKAAKYLNLYYRTPFEFRDLSMWFPSENKQNANLVVTVPEVTFVVPVYNAERFLMQTLESLRNQSLRNIEILCINDGSTDRSGAILEQYQNIDSRVRVITRINSGVSASRNLGIKESRGKYIAFVDGDDLVEPNMAEKCCYVATEFDLDVVAFDFQCFDCATGKKLDHYWTISNRASELPMGKIFNAEDFRSRSFSFYGSCWPFLWRKEFLEKYENPFPKIKISEDMCFIVNALSDAKRIMILSEVFYHYRRNVPGSAITSLKNVADSDPRLDTIFEMCRTIAKIDKKALSSPAKANVIGRLLSEMRYFAKLSKILENRVEYAIHLQKDILGSYISMLHDTGLKQWMEGVLRKQVVCTSTESKKEPVVLKFPELDKTTSFLWSKLQKKRKKTKHDLILVIAFLGSETADPLDSWTFFSWLQEHNIPSRFVISSNSLFYDDLVKKKKTKDVIALSKSCLQDDHAAYFLYKLFDPLCRSKAVVFEDFVWPWPLRTRFKAEDWKLIFLQHGVIYFRISKKIKDMLTRFNIVNTSSPVEKEFLEKEIGCREMDGEPYPEYVVAGLPRWDNLIVDHRNEQSEKVVFIMFTWRDIFQDPAYDIRESAYFNAIMSLFKSSFYDELKARGIKVIFAPHHRLLDIAAEVVKELPVELCQQKDISYWVKNASCLITDHSSISWDFMLQKKPVIHWALDWQDLTLGEDELSQLSFVSKQINMFTVPVHNIAELQKKLYAYIDNDFKISEDEHEKLEQLFPYREGFSQRVYEKLCCSDEQKGMEN